MALSKAKLAKDIKDKVGTLHLHPCLWAWVGHDPLGEGIHNGDEYLVAIHCPAVRAVDLYLHLRV